MKNYLTDHVKFGVAYFVVVEATGGGGWGGHPHFIKSNIFGNALGT